MRCVVSSRMAGLGIATAAYSPAPCIPAWQAMGVRSVPHLARALGRVMLRSRSHEPSMQKQLEACVHVIWGEGGGWTPEHAVARLSCGSGCGLGAHRAPCASPKLLRDPTQLRPSDLCSVANTQELPTVCLRKSACGVHTQRCLHTCSAHICMVAKRTKPTITHL